MPQLLPPVSDLGRGSVRKHYVSAVNYGPKEKRHCTHLSNDELKHAYSKLKRQVPPRLGLCHLFRTVAASDTSLLAMVVNGMFGESTLKSEGKMPKGLQS